MANMKRIGYISACIAGDGRYTSRVAVWTDGTTCEVLWQDTGAIGGMDGPGGSYSNGWEVRRTVPAKPKAIADAVREVCAGDHIIRGYGKPSKEFTWYRNGGYTVVAKGISVAKVKKVLETV